uniref:Uncharacterized protein n=1 Tax=Quercus lobata TaxID=97700 RepID=A0A7N2LNB1_QUELO
MTVPTDNSSSGSSANWLFNNKEHVKSSAAASLGMILLWDFDSGLAQMDKYFHASDSHVNAGALLGVGIVNCGCGIKNDCDPVSLTLDMIRDDTSEDCSRVCKKTETRGWDSRVTRGCKPPEAAHMPSMLEDEQSC